LIASATDQASLFNDLAQRLLKVFAPSGVTGVAILLPSDEIYPSVRALASVVGGEAEQRALRIEPQIYAAEAAWVLEHGATIGDTLAGAQQPDVERSPGSSGAEGLIYFIPLKSGQRTVGILGIT